MDARDRDAARKNVSLSKNVRPGWCIRVKRNTLELASTLSSHTCSVPGDCCVTLWRTVHHLPPPAAVVENFGINYARFSQRTPRNNGTVTRHKWTARKVLPPVKHIRFPTLSTLSAQLITSVLFTSVVVCAATTGIENLSVNVALFHAAYRSLLPFGPVPDASSCVAFPKPDPRS